MFAGNGLGDAAMTALASYLWHSPEPLWELGISDNRITDRGVEELLRCLYNHPSHPPRLPATAGSAGHVFPLRLDLRNNFVADQQGVVQRVESAGGAGSVQLCVT